MRSALLLRRQRLLQLLKGSRASRGIWILAVQPWVRQMKSYLKECSSRDLSGARACHFPPRTCFKRSSGCAVAEAQPVAAGH